MNICHERLNAADVILVFCLSIVLRLKSEDEEKNCRMLVHCIQVAPQFQYKKYEFEKFVTLSDRGDTVQAFPVMVCYFV